MRSDVSAVPSLPNLRRCAGLGIACALVTVLASAGQRWGEIRRPVAGDVLQAGQWTEVVWTALPAEVEELEILLSLDDGASFTVRLTPQLDPGRQSYRWRVPNFPSTRARLRLRVGIDHREIEGPLGGAFRIAGEPGQPVAGVRWLAGEWWTASHAWPVTPVEHRPERVSTQAPLALDVVGALLANDWTATLSAVPRSFQPSSPARRAVRVAPPVAGHSPLETPQRE